MLTFKYNIISYIFVCVTSVEGKIVVAPRMINLARNPLDFEYLYHNQYEMCDLKAAQMHERPFRAAKDHVLLLAALDSFLPF